MNAPKILVVTDNSDIFKRFLTISEGLGIRDVFDFAHSPGSEINILKSSFPNFSLKDNVRGIIETYNMVFSLHCKQIIPASIFKKIKCINFHPGYIPFNRGWYPQVFAIIYDLPFGVTIHEITEELDLGPIIDRQEIKVNSWDTSGSLYTQAIDLEEELIRRNLLGLINDNYSVFLPESKGVVYYKKDFERLRHVNLGEIKSVEGALKIMRALTHKGFNNAFFNDPETGEKVYFGLNIYRE